MQPRINTSIPMIKGSTSVILTKLYQSAKAPTIPGIETVDASNPVLRQCVAVDCLTAMEGNKVLTKNPLSKVLDYMEATIPRMPQNDIKKILTAQHSDAKKKLAEQQASEADLVKEYRDTLAKQTKTIETVLRMLVAQPQSMIGSLPIEQQLNRERDHINLLRRKIDSSVIKQTILSNTIQTLFDTFKKSTGERDISMARLIDPSHMPANR